MVEEETVEEAHAVLQAAVDSWSSLLIATGGALKPEKCFYHVISFVWDQKGKVSYEKNELKPEMQVTVLLPDGSRQPISHLSVDKELITLGVASCPSGLADAVLKNTKDKALEWANQCKNSHLCPRDVHFAVERKFWPKVKYGLCAITATYQDLVAAMDKPYYEILPLGGVIRSAKRELRAMDSGFYGVGLPHWGIESTIECINKMMTHVGAKSMVGTQYQMSLELLILELGLTDQPLLLDYEKYKDWVTYCNWTEMWSRMLRFDFKLTVNTVSISPPREGDRWFMRAVEELGFTAEECRIINLIRQHQQVVFESDVFGADGKKIDEKYFRRRRRGDKWSKYTFAVQHFPTKYFALWKEALMQLAPNGRRRHRFGKFLSDGHKTWDWRFDSESRSILKQCGDSVEVYQVGGANRRSSRSQMYSLDEVRHVEQAEGELCTVSCNSNGTIQLISHHPGAAKTVQPTSFVEVLQEWKGRWMWKNLSVSGSAGCGLGITSSDNFAWIKEAIESKSLFAVSDGSYIKQLHPELCSAAIILECQKSGGLITLSFAECSRYANAYRGELLGLMTIHLLLLSFNKVWPELRGEVHIYSDCLGALDKVENLPPRRIPSKCRHSDVLKNIMANCSELTFVRKFSHVKAHQDDAKAWEEMERPAQMNCGCDHGAKDEVFSTIETGTAKQQEFPLEPLVLFVGGEKVTTD
jgi:hypothetical protein